MLRSMTGYGSSFYEDESYKIFIEIKTVNSRYCDISIKLPKYLDYLEMDFRRIIKKALLRGKVDINIYVELFSENSNVVKVNELLLGNYISAINESINRNCEKIKDFAILSSDNLYNFHGIIYRENYNDKDDVLEKVIFNELEKALNNLNNSREKEGKELEKDISLKLSEIKDILTNISKRENEYVELYKKKLYDSFTSIIEKNSISICDDRIAVEVGILADKLCIDEELVRLNSHISQAYRLITDNNYEVGRKFDFMLQEFNRESNTILSKAVDINIINYGVELKFIIEKIREQVQNLV